VSAPIQADLLGDMMALDAAPQPFVADAIPTPPRRPPDPVGPTRWSADDPDVVIPEQPATAVYKNAMGGVVICQQRGWNEGEDPFVWIQPRNLPAHIAALQRHLPR
jgi:hypothetical protein